MNRRKRFEKLLKHSGDEIRGKTLAFRHIRGERNPVDGLDHNEGLSRRQTARSERRRERNVAHRGPARGLREEHVDGVRHARVLVDENLRNERTDGRMLDAVKGREVACRKVFAQLAPTLERLSATQRRAPHVSPQAR